MMRPAHRKEEALWLLERFVPGTGVNNLSLAFAVDGRLQHSAVQDALTFLVRRHESLRTVFTSVDGGLSKQTLDADEVKVVVRSSDLPADAESGPALDAVLTEYVGAPFAIDGELLLRAQLFHGGQGDVFCVALHHLVFDTISTTTLFMEFTAAYHAFASGEEPDESLAGVVPAAVEPEPSDRSMRFWRKQLRDFDAVRPELWLGREVGEHPDLVGDTVDRPLSAEAVDVVRRLQKDLRASEAVVLLAAYYLLLAGHGAGPDLVVGSPVNSRGAEDAEAIGYHVNVVPLRLRVDPTVGFDKLVRGARGVFMNSLSYADMPVDSLLLEVDRADSGWRNTLFRHVFNYVPGVHVPEFDFGGLTARFLTVENGYSKFDLEFFVLPSADGIRVRTVYHTGAFERAEVEMLLRRYEALLLAVGADLERPVGEIPIWADTDHTVIAETNRGALPVGTDPEPAADGSRSTVLAAVAEQARANPDAVAVLDGDRSLTYRQVWNSATRTAERLLAAGVGGGDVVAVAAKRSAELAAATLGVWLAGAAYLPIDPEHPERRVTYQLTDSGARCVLHAPGVTLPDVPGLLATEMDTVGAGSETESPAAPEAGGDTAPDDLAYLIYTSGSTGLPKGTLLSHRNLANLLEHFRGELAAQPGESTLWLTTFTFDISALELFLPLVSGGRLVVAPDEARTDGTVLAALLDQHAVRTVQATPTTWRLVADGVGDSLAGRNVLCGGEPLTAELARTLVATGGVLRNVYGPTETTIWSAAARLDDPAVERVSVGRPIRDTQLFVTAPDGRELPLLVPGELCIAGAGVALGYHQRAELTAERFGEHATFGRFYRTGDRARWLPDGTVEVLGRSDRQVKLRGVRVELGEVESVLAGHPRVRSAAVVMVDDEDAGRGLVAFVTGPPQPEEAALAEELWEYAAARLPRASVPQEFALLTALPTNASLKTDYPALVRTAERRRAEASVARSAPAERDDLVAGLIVLWQEILGRGDITPETNFFTHGGHSLLGVRLVQRIEETTGVTIRLPDIFTYSSPAAVAAFIREGGGSAD